MTTITGLKNFQLTNSVCFSLSQKCKVNKTPTAVQTIIDYFNKVIIGLFVDILQIDIAFLQIMALIFVLSVVCAG